VQEVKQSQGLLTPNLSVGAQSLWLSNNLVEASLGQKGEMTISGNLNLEQVLFSEPALANIAIKKLLKENTDEQERQTLLDDVVNITHSYISVLLAKANLILQNENLNVTKQNLVVAESKEQLGLSKQSDVNRWLSELNINQIQLSTAQANFKKAVYALNETLNQPINTAYTFPDSIDIQAALKFPEDLLTPYLKDEFLIETLADFYISEMKEDAPELLQLQFSEQILKRKIQSERRQFYLPKLVGFASANDIFMLEGLQANPQLPVPPPPQDLTWNAGIGESNTKDESGAHKTG
jgi:outer membrane protein TolC